MGSEKELAKTGCRLKRRIRSDVMTNRERKQRGAKPYAVGGSWGLVMFLRGDVRETLGFVWLFLAT